MGYVSQNIKRKRWDQKKDEQISSIRKEKEIPLIDYEEAVNDFSLASHRNKHSFWSPLIGCLYQRSDKEYGFTIGVWGPQSACH